MQPGERFEVLEELGRGAMGVVYRARDRESDREVALKVVGQQLDDRRRERFRREGELTARLVHPGIVGVHSSGTLKDRPYLAYELVRGRELGEVLLESDLERKVELLRDVAAALGHAHEHGIVHRDVKPDNVLVDEHGRVRVADFGLATAADLERMTLSGAVVGTPSYMSPEQIGGSSEVGPAADVWALGVVLYEALTGDLPFAGNTMVELAGQILNVDPVRPRSIDPQVPRALEAICLKALARRPTERYAGGAAFAADLDAFAQGTRSGLGRGLVLRPRLGLLGGAVALAVVAGGGLVAVALSPDPPDSPHEGRERGEQPAREPTDAELASAARELDGLLGLDPPRRYEEIGAWLAGHSEHPDAVRAREARRVAQLSFPVRRFVHAEGQMPVVGSFVGDEAVATLGDDGMLRLWGRGDGALRWELKVRSLARFGLAASPDGASVVVGKKGGAWIVDVRSQAKRDLQGLPRGAHPHQIEFAGDGSLLTLTTVRRGIHVFAWPSLECVVRLEQSFARILAVSHDGRRVAAGGGPWMDLNMEKVAAQRDFFALWELGQSGSAARVEERQAPLTALAFAPAGDSLVLGDTSGRFYRADLDDLQRRVEFQAEQEAPDGAVFYKSTAHTGEMRGAVVTPEGVVVTAAKKRGNGHGIDELAFWDLETRRELRRLPVDVSVLSLRGSPDGEQVLVSTVNGLAELHQAQAR